MCRAACVLSLLAFCVGITHSWDFVVSLKEQLVFYTDGTEPNIVHLPSQNPTSLVYDDIHNRILYVDKQSNNDIICGYNIISSDNKCYTLRNGRNIVGLAFDPITEIIFFTDTINRSINTISLRPGNNYTVYFLDQITPAEIVVDSCGGYIYWVNKLINGNTKLLERARFDGFDRQVLLETHYQIFGLAIDLQTQNVFYFDDFAGAGYINSADLKEANEIILAQFHAQSTILTVSKDTIYFTNSGKSGDTVYQLPMSARLNLKPQIVTKFFGEKILGIVANYKFVDQIKGIQNCEPLASRLPTTPVASGNTSEELNISVCNNCCQHGNCSFNDEGLPKCSCDTDYSGNKCHGYCPNNCTCSLNEKNEPICQCKEKRRCEVSPCLNYCLQGSCSVNEKGLPICSCNAGYSGDKCEVSVCRRYCLNNGICSLNEEGKPVCQCDGNHEGARCEADISDTSPKYDGVERNQTLAYLLSILQKPSSEMYLTVEV